MALVVRQGLTLVTIGVVVGVGIAWLVTRAFASVLVLVSTTDPLTFIVVPAILMAVGLVASYLPARRVLRVDPVTALRNE